MTSLSQIKTRSNTKVQPGPSNLNENHDSDDDTIQEPINEDDEEEILEEPTESMKKQMLQVLRPVFSTKAEEPLKTYKHLLVKIAQRTRYMKKLDEHKQNKTIPKCIVPMKVAQVPSSIEESFNSKLKSITERANTETLNLIITTRNAELKSLEEEKDATLAKLEEDITNIKNELLNKPSHLSKSAIKEAFTIAQEDIIERTSKLIVEQEVRDTVSEVKSSNEKKQRLEQEITAVEDTEIQTLKKNLTILEKKFKQFQQPRQQLNQKVKVNDKPKGHQKHNIGRGKRHVTPNKSKENSKQPPKEQKKKPPKANLKNKSAKGNPKGDSKVKKSKK